MMHIRAKATGELLHSLDLDSLAGADLHDMELRCADLKGRNLSGANLSHAALDKADLSGADLSNADLRGVRMTDADLSGANLSQVNLDTAWLIGASLKNADLSSARLTDALLWHADLSNAVLENTDLHGSAFNAHTIWPDGFKPKDFRATNILSWETDQTVDDQRPDGLHSAQEFVPLVDQRFREALTRIRRSIHRRARTARVWMQFCDLPEDSLVEVEGERVWAEYAVGSPSYWRARFLDSKVVINGDGKQPYEIPYADIKSIGFPSMKSAHLPGGILMPKKAEHDGKVFLFDAAVIDTHSGARHEVKAAVGRDGLRDISFWYEIVRGALVDQDRESKAASAPVLRRGKRSCPIAVVVVRSVEDNHVVRVHIVSMCEQTIERLKLTRDLPQGYVAILAPSGSTQAHIKGRTLVLDEPVTLQSGEALTFNVV